MSDNDRDDCSGMGDHIHCASCGMVVPAYFDVHIIPDDGSPAYKPARLDIRFPCPQCSEPLGGLFQARATTAPIGRPEGSIPRGIH
jgi:predicted RNA-binding Zn-ribbon protein involved in translation (DUF1610 family)